MRIKADSQDGTSARSRQHGERGYVLLVFTLFAAFLFCLDLRHEN